MRKIIVAALTATMLMPAMASAQSYGEVRDSRREVRESQRDLNRAYRNGDRRDVREARQELREDRRELREDWRDFRRSNPGQFRRGAYAAPRGYAYRPVAPGYRFQPSYLGQRYWVNDWQRYRLARPYAGQRYIRYGNDVVLVDARSGRVIRSYNSFFY
jgi:Ni/Co efflux regulator RcnB